MRADSTARWLVSLALAGCAEAQSVAPARPTAAVEPPSPQLDVDVDVEAELEAAFQKLYRDLDRAGARAGLERVVAADPKRADALTQLALLLAEERRFPEALRVAERRVALGPRDAAALDLRAEIRLLSGDFAGAEGGFREVLAIDPTFVAARTAIASSRFYRGDWDGGLAELAEALERETAPERRLELGLALGWAQIGAEKWGEGHATLQRAVAEQVRARGYSLLEASIAIEERRWADAQRAAESTLARAKEARADAPALRRINMVLGVAAARAGDRAAAARALAALEEGAAALPPYTTKDVTFVRAHIAAAAGDTHEATLLFGDKWVQNHMSLADPGRATPQASLGQFAVQSRLLAAEALLGGERTDEARHAIDQVSQTFHRGIGAVLTQRHSMKVRAMLNAPAR